MKKDSEDLEYYKGHDFGDEMRKAVDEGKGFAGKGDSVARFLAKARAIRTAENGRKMYSFRLKVAVVNSIRKKAKAAGVPYQTYVGALLEQAAESR